MLLIFILHGVRFRRAWSIVSDFAPQGAPYVPLLFPGMPYEQSESTGIGTIFVLRTLL